jgi:hypothetical protein
MENYQSIEERAKELKASPHIQIILEYGVEEKGIRFPSEYSILEEYINTRREHFVCLDTTVFFKNYKFFVVETEVRY